MQLEETIAKELAGIIKAQTAKCQTQIDALATATEALTKAVAGLQDEVPPADVIEDISKAVALLAEAPPLTHVRDNGPVVVQFTPPHTGKKIKTITTRRDDKGNLVARVVEDAD